MSHSSFAQALRPAEQQVFSIPGKSLQEKRAQWSWSTLPLVIKACRALPSCQMTPAENQILDKVIANLPWYMKDSLQFESESTHPDQFTSDKNEAHRVAITGNTPQSRIILNLDRLVELSWKDLLSLLGHEVVHHTGVLDDESRIPDQVGAKLGRYFELNSVALSLAEQRHPEIQALSFGVSVPETTDYFQIFPVPTVSVHARTAILDSENIFDIDSFEPYSPFHCYGVPGSAFVNEQVSNPQLHVARWFPGEAEVSVNLNVLIRSVCLITAHAPDAGMKASYAVGQTSVQLVLKNPNLKTWQDSVLSIRADFVRANFRPRSDQENPQVAEFAQYEKTVSAPASVVAGSTYRLQVLIRFEDASQSLPCEAPFTADRWHSLDMTSFVPFFKFDRCQAEQQSPSLYLVTLEKDFPLDSVAGFYSIETLGFIASKSSQEITASFPNKISFEVINPVKTGSLKILSAEFPGLKNQKLIPDKTYDFEVRIENADSIYSGFVSGRFVETSGHHLDFMEEIAHSTKSMFRLVSYQKEGSILIAKYKALVPGKSQNASVRRIELYQFSYLTTNFAEAYLDLRQKPLVFEVAD